MKFPVLRRGTYANVVSTLALVLAVGGTSAYAATVITTKQIKNGTIRAVDLHAGSVNGSKVVDHSLTKTDLAPGTLPVVPAPYGGVKGYTSFSLDVPFDDTLDGITAVSVPPGTYLASAVTTIYNGGASESLVTCTLEGDAVNDSKSVYVEKSAVDSPNRMVMSFQLADTFEAAGQFRLACQRSGGTSVAAHDTRINVVKVDSLQVQD